MAKRPTKLTGERAEIECVRTSAMVVIAVDGQAPRRSAACETCKSLKTADLRQRKIRGEQPSERGATGSAGAGARADARTVASRILWSGVDTSVA
jgi:hypothetical protein